MRKNKGCIDRLVTEIKNHRLIYILLSVILIGCFIARVYRIDQLLGFYYDQGRDALAIWNLWEKGDFFLIGPVTGLAGIFLGPAYYYIIAPFYKLGNGSPIYPSIFLSFTTTVAAFMLYILGKKFHSREAGLFAATIFSFSYFLALASRWLSNPTMIILGSVALVWAMYEITQKKRWVWPVSALILGLNLQFEAASAVFYLPAYFIFVVWQRKNLPSFKISILTIVVLLSTFIPQVLFDVRHEGVIGNSIARELFVQKAFRPSIWEVAKIRFPMYFHYFSTKVVPFKDDFNMVALVVVTFTFFIFRRRIFVNEGIKIVFLIFISPLVGYLFFQGNLGRVYDYYFTGYYLPFVLILAIGLAQLYKFKFTKPLVFLFFIVFFVVNGRSLQQFGASVDRPTHISLGNQIRSIQWILDDSKLKPFNVDFYVPPIVPYSYDYLFLWQTNSKCGTSLCNMKLDEHAPLLYTLYEVDSPHPERLKAWLSRHEGIGIVQETIKFGGITVERRTRISDEGLKK